MCGYAKSGDNLLAALLAASSVIDDMATLQAAARGCYSGSPLICAWSLFPYDTNAVSVFQITFSTSMEYDIIYV